MDISIRKQFCSGLKVVLFLAVTLFFSTARAQFPMFPPAPYEIYPPTAPEFIVGGYTVDWQDTSGSICWLSERVNNGSWAAVPNTYSPTKTITLSRSVGNYDYQVACIDDYGGVLGPISSVGVVSSMPTLDPLDVQLGYSFQVRTGHFNGDGKKDIYIKRTGGNADNGVIYKTILTQNNDGNFDVVENPTSGQLSNAAGWPVSSGVDAVVNDFNVDGRVDVTPEKSRFSTIPAMLMTRLFIQLVSFLKVMHRPLLRLILSLRNSLEILIAGFLILTILRRQLLQICQPIIFL